MSRSSVLGEGPDRVASSRNDSVPAPTADLRATGPLTSDGAGWRAAAWAAALLGIALTQYFSALEPSGIWYEFSMPRFKAGVAAFVVLCVGILCGFKGASLGAAAGDRRFPIILPVYANIASLIWFFSRPFRPM